MVSSVRFTPARQIYPRRFLARYGEHLQREELRLVQGFRGLPGPLQRELLDTVAHLVVLSARRRS